MSSLRHGQVDSDQQGLSSGLTEKLLSSVTDSPTHIHRGTSHSFTHSLSQTRWTPEEEASFWSKLTYSYASGLIKLGYTQPLHQQHLCDMAPKRKAAVVTDKFHVALNDTKDPLKAPHVRPLRL